MARVLPTVNGETPDGKHSGTVHQVNLIREGIPIADAPEKQRGVKEFSFSEVGGGAKVPGFGFNFKPVG
jgi:hypothetical protein